MIPQTLKDNNEGLGKWAILIGYRGSIAHGMFIPNTEPNSIDDKDVMSICIPPIDYYFGLNQFHSRGTQEIKKDEWDIVVYELKKFVSMLCKANPNVISMLWLEPQHYTYISSVGKLLIENRDLFLTLQIYHSFIGYAHDQLKKMTHLGSIKNEKLLLEKELRRRNIDFSQM